MHISLCRADETISNNGLSRRSRYGALLLLPHGGDGVQIGYLFHGMRSLLKTNHLHTLYPTAECAVHKCFGMLS